MDRKSRFLLTSKVAKKDALSVLNVSINLFSGLPFDKRRTITPDRGSEFALYHKFSKAANIDCYFLIHRLLGNAEPTKIQMDYYESTC